MYDPFDSFRQYREQIRQLTEPLSIVKQMQDAAAQQRLQLIQGVGLDGMFTDQLRDMASSIGRYAEEIQTNHSSAISIANKALGESWASELAALSDSVRNAFLGISPEDFQIEALSSFRDDMQSLSRSIASYGRAPFSDWADFKDDELDEARAEIGEIRASSNSPRELISALVKWMETANPALKGVVIHLLWPVFLAVLSNILTPEVQEWWRELDGHSPREASKIVAREVSEWYDDEVLASRRIVKATALFVRDQPSRKGSVVSKLPLGTVVRLVEKGRHWSRVEYFDSEEACMKEGWVFARYLVALRP